ncbi:MAG: hypothetical protein HKO59_11325, partial [Phycisphaerales bacterium]|nr:hypothetical protein [Phycisphaerae bacterium]NNM26553.1 hypothetical protein [Phycisphaerales bacterium]
MPEPNGTIRPPRTGRPRVVMVLANEFTHDTRVYKEAQSLIAWGCDVHVLAMTGVGLPVAEVQDGISVHRIDRPRGAVWRLPIAAAVWWCPPLLRRLFPAVPPPRAESSRPTVPPASAALPPPPAPPAPANSDAPAPPDAPATPDAPPADVDRGSAVWRRRFRGAARRILGPDLTHDFAEGARRVRRGGVRRLR